MDARPLSDKCVFTNAILHTQSCIYSQPFPSMDGLAQIVEVVIQHFGIKRFIGFGIGAGANVMLRYAVCELLGLITY